LKAKSQKIRDGHALGGKMDKKTLTTKGQKGVLLNWATLGDPGTGGKTRKRNSRTTRRGEGEERRKYVGF